MITEIALRSITKEDVEQLKEDRVREGMSLDYKESLPSDSDESKKEFLYDISSFANSNGGLIMFGVKEERDQENRPTGTPLSVD